MRADNFEHFEFQSRVNLDEADEMEPSNILMEDDGIDNNSIERNDDVVEETAFTTITDEKGEEIIIRTSTLVWMLSEPSGVISKDRLRRVQVSNTKQ